MWQGGKELPVAVIGPSSDNVSDQGLAAATTIHLLPCPTRRKIRPTNEVERSPVRRRAAAWSERPIKQHGEVVQQHA